MAAQKEIIRHLAWSAEAEAGLADALNGCAELYRDQVNAGIADLYQIGADSWTVLRTEYDRKGRRYLVGCLFQGKGYIEFSAYVLETAKINGFDFVRVHTERRGIGRWLVNRFGFQASEVNDDETVYLKAL